jgi:serine/threonine protein kinase
MEYCPGGDLGKQIKLKRKLSEHEARSYICEVILAIEYLHKNNIIFRDLKPENIVLDRDGHIKLTDFGLSKENVGNLFDNNSFVGSIAYLAPEILKKQPHSKSIDWYLTGVLLYEMLVGIPPYYNNNRKILFENIQSGPLRIPHTMSLEARDLILNLLNRNPKKRLGASEADSEDLKVHKFFKGINWDDVAELKIEMPKITVN